MGSKYDKNSFVIYHASAHFHVPNLCQHAFNYLVDGNFLRKTCPNYVNTSLLSRTEYKCH